MLLFLGGGVNRAYKYNLFYSHFISKLKNEIPKLIRAEDKKPVTLVFWPYF